MPGIRITYSRGKRRRPMPSGVTSLASVLARRGIHMMSGRAAPSTASGLRRRALLGR